METRKRPKLVKPSLAMERISVLLGEELLRWPKVRSHPMFGLTAFYREESVFALLPAKRAMESANAIAYKVPRPEHKREGEKWKFFELEDERSIPQALNLLGEAYEAHRRPRRKK